MQVFNDVLFSAAGFQRRDQSLQIAPQIGYAHSWALGTKTRSHDPTVGPAETESTSRDLQIGRFLFGVTYRVTDRASINWSVEVGATDDATDLRTSIRIPLTLIAGGG